MPKWNLPQNEYLAPAAAKARLTSVQAKHFPDRTTESGISVYQAAAGFWIGMKPIPQMGVYEVSYHNECPCVHS